MIIQLHTPNGIVNVDSDKVTDEELGDLHITRESLPACMPRDYLAELDELKAEIKRLKDNVG